MALKLFVGNLDLETTSRQLRELFGRFGTVNSAEAAHNYQTGEGHGYGYIDMPHDSEAESAMNGLEGFSLQGRLLTVRRR